MNFRLTDYFKERILKGLPEEIQMLQDEEDVGYFYADLVVDAHYTKRDIVKVDITLRKDDGTLLAKLDTVELQPGSTRTLKGAKILSEFRVTGD
jgi:hypothetical protein